jgi:hypothetical protein
VVSVEAPANDTPDKPESVSSSEKLLSVTALPLSFETSTSKDPAVGLEVVMFVMFNVKSARLAALSCKTAARLRRVIASFFQQSGVRIVVRFLAIALIMDRAPLGIIPIVSSLGCGQGNFDPSHFLTSL